jgi:hypothetical protein
MPSSTGPDDARQGGLLCTASCVTEAPPGRDTLPRIQWFTPRHRAYEPGYSGRGDAPAGLGPGTLRPLPSQLQARQAEALGRVAIQRGQLTSPNRRIRTASTRRTGRFSPGKIAGSPQGPSIRTTSPRRSTSPIYAHRSRATLSYSSRSAGHLIPKRSTRITSAGSWRHWSEAYSGGTGMSGKRRASLILTSAASSSDS